jgi:hypothetical protein
MTTLSTIQAELLRAVATAPNGAVDASTARRATIASLVKRGCLISVPEADGPSRLFITEAGRAKIGAEHPPEPEVKAIPIAPAPQGTGKIKVLVDLLRRLDGATVEAMMAATGWQAHSVRGAISGSIKKALGLAVTSEKLDAGRIYRIVSEGQV